MKIHLREIPEFQHANVKAASAMFNFEERLFVACDDSYSLFELSNLSHFSNGSSWIEHRCDGAISLPAEPIALKKAKPDLESIFAGQNSIFCLPSFSRPNRKIGTRFDLKTNKLAIHDFTKLYESLELAFRNETRELNIEGSLILGKELILINRGVADTSTLILRLDLETFQTLETRELKFPRIENCCCHGTEVFFFKNKLHVLFAAEEAVNSYDDGKVLGSGVAILDPNSLQIVTTYQFDKKIKTEGLSFYREQFITCSDPDGAGLSQFFSFDI